mmetsp:Transcript_104335/g.292332  ORF Transcript_104335/g.292332 Transcript_104335/m.292332 type:complete len:255 (+) Transcript_104335:172-936(+)
MDLADMQLETVSWYCWFSSRRASVSSAMALEFSSKLFSLSAMSFNNPVSGWLMASSSFVTSASKASICFVLDSMFVLLDVRASSHQVFCLRSCAASSFSSSFILSISARTTVKGLPRARRPAILATRVSLAFEAASRSTRWAADRWLRIAPPWTRRLTERSCTKAAVPPVAATLSKAPEAWSLSSMAMASVMAASSFARISTRWSYSFAFWLHMSSNFSRNDVSSSNCVFAVSREVFFVARSPSLEPKEPCFFW